jgi:hypothetical protein
VYWFEIFLFKKVKSILFNESILMSSLFFNYSFPYTLGLLNRIRRNGSIVSPSYTMVCPSYSMHRHRLSSSVFLTANIRSLSGEFARLSKQRKSLAWTLWIIISLETLVIGSVVFVAPSVVVMSTSIVTICCRLSLLCRHLS